MLTSSCRLKMVMLPFSKVAAIQAQAGSTTKSFKSPFMAGSNSSWVVTGFLIRICCFLSSVTKRDWDLRLYVIMTCSLFNTLTMLMFSALLVLGWRILIVHSKCLSAIFQIPTLPMFDPVAKLKLDSPKSRLVIFPRALVSLSNLYSMRHSRLVSHPCSSSWMKYISIF